MLQFYLLSVIVNFFAGLASASEFLCGKFKRLEGMKEILSRPGMEMFLGLLAVAVAIFKLIFPVRVPVAGDLIPVIAGFALGITLLVDFYKSKSDVESASVTAMQKIFVGHKSIIGMLGILVSFIHFLFPRVLFL